MQGVRGSNPLSSTRHNASSGLPRRAVRQQDVAVETAAKAALRARAPVSFPGSGYAIRPARRAEQQREYLPWVLDQLLASRRELQAAGQGDWSALREARHLHDYRNMVHHHGVVPSPQDLERQRFRAADFIDSLASSFFGRQLNELSRGRWSETRRSAMRSWQLKTSLLRGIRSRRPGSQLSRLNWPDSHSGRASRSIIR